MTKRSFILTLFFALYFSDSILLAQQVNTAKLDSLFTTLGKNNKAMCRVVLSKNGKVLYDRSIGYYKLGEKESLHSTEKTKYRIGSVSKMFTATMIFQLIEEKKLSLQTPLADFFPQIPNAKEITIALMLNHHSGIHDFTRDSDFTVWMLHPRTEEQMLDMMSKQSPEFAPNEKGKYSNTNFVLLGYIIERVTKSSYGKELKKRIADKIGLKDTYYGGKIDSKKNEAASFQFVTGKWNQLPESDMSIPHGAGSIVSTPMDLTIFIDALFKHKLVNDSILKRMTTIKDGYGMGIFQFPFYERSSFGHNGHIDGFTTAVDYYPADSMVMTICCNGLHYNFNNIAIGILSIYYKLPYSIPSFDSFVINPEKLSGYEGTYASNETPMKIMIKKEGDHLTAQATGQSSFPLEALSDFKFQFEDAGVLITFFKNSDDKMDKFSLNQGGATTFFDRE